MMWSMPRHLQKVTHSEDVNYAPMSDLNVERLWHRSLWRYPKPDKQQASEWSYPRQWRRGWSTWWGWRRCPCSELCLCLRKPDSNTARPQLQKFDWDGVKLRCVVELGINGGDSGIRSNRNSGSSRQWRWRRTAADVDLAGCWHLWKITKKIIEKALRNVKRSCWGHQFCGSKAFSRIQQESNVS